MRTITTPLRINGATIRNRLYRAPVLEGAGDGDDAAAAYAKQFVANAEAGVGLIIQGSSCIFPEGRTSPGMTLFDERDKVLRMAPMVDAVHAAGASLFVQLGHGGLYSMEAWHEPYASQRRGPLLAASKPPLVLRPTFRGVPVHVMSTQEIRDMATRYGDIAVWCREAGYDGIQLGSENAKLLDQLLSPFYNHRTDEFGGSLERRASVLRHTREAVAERAGADYPCTVKVPAEVSLPLFPRTSRDEALRLCALVEDFGFDAVTPVEVSVFPDTTLSRGGVPSSLWTHKGMTERFRRASPRPSRRFTIRAGAWVGGKRAPFTPVWNRDLIADAKAVVSIPVFAIGGIRTAEECDELLDGGQADMVGIGRPFYAEPDLPRRILDGARGPGLCRNSNHCVPAQMLGMKGTCYNPDVVKLRTRA